MEEDKKPQRLQSISTRGGRGGRGMGRGGRFMPKAVDRRSKEERESSAPAMKPAEPEPSEDSKPSRGKFERRKPKQLGIRAEAAGPLAAPSIAGPSRSTTRVSGSSGSTGSRGGGVRVKTETDPSIHMMANDERIDMASPHGGLFPMRLPTGESAETEEETAVEASSSSINSSDEKRHSDGSAHSLSELKDGDMVLVQLPDLGLRAGTEIVREGVRVKSEEPADTAAAGQENPAVRGSRGQMGKIVCYKSGRMVYIIGDSVFELQSAPVRSEDDVVLLDDRAKSASLLGPTSNRFLVTPDLTKLGIS